MWKFVKHRHVSFAGIILLLAKQYFFDDLAHGEKVVIAAAAMACAGNVYAVYMEHKGRQDAAAWPSTLQHIKYRAVSYLGFLVLTAAAFLNTVSERKGTLLLIGLVLTLAGPFVAHLMGERPDRELGAGADHTRAPAEEASG